jgi:hypothetical protein
MIYLGFSSSQYSMGFNLCRHFLQKAGIWKFGLKLLILDTIIIKEVIP